MKISRYILVLLGIIFYFSSAYSDQVIRRSVSSANGDDVPLAWTHILPSTAVIPSGTFAVGTVLGFGMFDLIDFTSNLVLDVEGVFNIGTKIAVYHDHDFAFAPWVYFLSEAMTTTDQFGNQNTTNSTAWEPGATFSYRLASEITGHTGGMFVVRNPTIPQSMVQNPRTALIQGNTMNQEFTFGMSSRVALSTGISYDFSYQIFGAGASIHISGLQVGGHYYFNVGQGNFMPILGAAYTGNF